MSSLKSSVVVRNEFSIRLPDGTGTRGSTPGAYVLDYIARDSAVESVAPAFEEDMDRYVTRYMAREEACERARAEGEAPEELAREIERDAGLGGVAFGCDGRGPAQLSLSDERLRELSARIQQGFEEGRPVLKTVLSFTEEYLRDHDLVDAELVVRMRGDYAGHLDQGRLRAAIAHGMDRLSGRFSELMWVGAIQVDTLHVHCHLCGVDLGVGRLRRDGKQNGCLSASEMSLLRRGIDAALDDTHAMARAAALAQAERTNARAVVFERVCSLARERALPQDILAALPEDRGLWAARSRDARMSRANELTRAFVEDALGLGGKRASEASAAYAEARGELEGLGERERARLAERGRERLVLDAMNACYRALREVPEGELSPATAALSALTSPGAGPTGPQDGPPSERPEGLEGAALRVRVRASRLRAHVTLAQRWRKASADEALGASSPLRRFAAFEADYQDDLSQKYAQLAGGWAVEARFAAEIEALAAAQMMAEAWALIAAEGRLAGLSAEEAERRGRELYGVSGAAVAARGPKGVLERAGQARERAAGLAAALTDRLSRLGLALDGARRPHVVAGQERPAGEAMAADLHDEARQAGGAGVRVGRAMARSFARRARERFELMRLARDEAKGLGVRLPERDCADMLEVAEALEAALEDADAAVIEQEGAPGAPERLSVTVTLDHGLAEALRQAARDGAAGPAGAGGQQGPGEEVAAEGTQGAPRLRVTAVAEAGVAEEPQGPQGAPQPRVTAVAETGTAEEPQGPQGAPRTRVVAAEHAAGAPAEGEREGTGARDGREGAAAGRDAGAAAREAGRERARRELEPEQEREAERDQGPEL